MPKLRLSVRIAASLIFLLSLAHTILWAALAYWLRLTGIEGSQFAFLYGAIYAIAAAGIFGLAVSIGVFRAKRWARLAALVVAALTALASGLALLVVGVLIALAPQHPVFFDEVAQPDRSELFKIALVYFVVFSVALWWIFLFSRKNVAAQFSPAEPENFSAPSGNPSCPSPIAVLAWLMIVSSALGAVSWPLILGKIPAMLFTHIFAPATSKWIWIANITLFLACGVGLLKLQRWSYAGTMGLHVFWLLSVFVTQLSAGYDAYTRRCIEALGLAETYPVLNRFHPSPWLSAIATAIPTALLIAGLFYYRRSFLQAVHSSRHRFS